MDRYEIEDAQEILDRTVKPFGSGGAHITVPKRCQGRGEGRPCFYPRSIRRIGHALQLPVQSRDGVGTNVGILKYAHGADGHAIEGPNLSEDRERSDHEQRTLLRKEHGSANYRKQQWIVARRRVDLKRKRRDFRHELSAYYTREYDLVAVEDLDAKGLIELPPNSRTRDSASWRTFLRMLEYKRSAKRLSSSPSIREGRRKSAPSVAFRPTNRCGSGNIRVVVRIQSG